MRTLLIFGYISLWTCQFSTGQQYNFRFDHLAPENGLSQSQAFTIYQDRYGYIWMGTQDGLNRFDGYEFKVYKSIPFDSSSLSHSWIWNVNEDAKGNLWVATFRGLCRFDRKHETFERYFHDPEDPRSISANRSNYIINDKKGRLWIACWGAGINLYDPETNSFTQFVHNPEDPSSISDNFVRSIYCDSEGTMWLGSWNGHIDKMIETTDGFKFETLVPPVPLSNEYRISSITEDLSGELWIATREQGLFQYNKKNNEFRQHLHGEKLNVVTCDSKGNLWVGSLNKGIYFLPSGTNQFINMRHDPHDPVSIHGDNVSSVMEDKTGIIWLGTNGVNRYDPSKSVFQNYVHKPGDNESLAQNLVWTFCESDNGKDIWVGTESGPLNLLNRDNGKFKYFYLKDSKGNVGSNIRKIIRDKTELWIATHGFGLIHFDPATGYSDFLNHDPTWPLLSPMLAIQDILLKGNELWVGSNGHGLLIMDLVARTSTLYKHDPQDPASLCSNYVNVLFEDTSGNIWIGGWGGGISKFDKQTKTFKNFAHDPKNPASISNDIISDIIQTHDSLLWIATNEGLNQLNINTGKFRYFLEKDGLTNNVVYQVQQDSKGFLWLSTNIGFSRFDPVNETFTNYTYDDGLPANEFNANASLKTDDGWMCFGSIHGFTLFQPDNLYRSIGFPPLVIHSFKILNQPVPFDPHQPIQLNYKENYLTIRFTALEYSAPHKIRYSHKLEGLEEDWVPAGMERSATYTNLDPGEYVFRVRATSRDGVWNDQEVTLHITISPPFWKRSWFMILSVMVCGAVIYGLHQYRVQQSIRLERLRNKIASDLHDEVGSNLTRISIYSDLLQNGINETERKGYLKSIGVLSREIVSTMSDIVWSIDNRSDTLGSLIIRMKDFATEVLQAKNIDLEFRANSVDESKVFDPVLKQNLYLIFKESVNNILKHAHATKVIVEIMPRQGGIIMTIYDNGRGFNYDTLVRGNGLRNMSRRAQAIGASYEIESDNGTTVRVACRNI